MAVIDFPILYIPDPTKGRPLFSGQIFVGIPDLDPEVVINQKQLNVIQEDGTVVPVDQPFLLSAGGVPIYQNQTVRLDVDGNYSLKILDKLGAQTYFVDNVLEDEPITELEVNVIIDASNDRLNPDTLAIWQADATAVVGDVVTTKERSTGEGGGATGDVISGTGTADGKSIVAHNTLNLSWALRTNGEFRTREVGGTNNASVNATVDISKTSQNIHIDGVPNYDQDVQFKGREHETSDLPFQLNSQSIPGGGLNARMTISNGYLYNCGFGINAIQAFSLADPREPELVNSWGVSSQPRHIDIIGRHALVCCHGAAKIEFWDISNPGSPGLVGEITTGANPKMFELAGNEIYVVCSGTNTLEKYTFQLPSEGDGLGFSFIKIGGVVVSGTPLCCAFNGEGLVAVSGLETNNIDLVGSSTLNLIQTTGVGGAGHASCVWATKTQLLVSDTTANQVHSVNYESITSPLLTASVDVVSKPEQIEIIGNRFYVPSLENSVTQAKLSAVDITDVKAPVEYKQIDLTVKGAGFTTYYQDGNNGYLYVNGHFTPFNIEVIEVVIGEDDGKPENVHENLQARTMGASKLDAGINNITQRYDTVLVNTTATKDSNVIRVGSGADITLPDPATVRGKQITIVNVAGANTSDVINLFTGFSGTLAANASVTVVAMHFGGGSQWDAISSFGTIT